MMNGSQNQGHVRYPLYNASKNETLKIEERGKTSWEKPPPPPQSTMHQKKEEGRKAVAKKLCPSLQDDHKKVELLLSKCLGEDVCSLFSGWTVLQIDDPIMYHLSDVMHMDLDVFGPLSLH
jgi:hypothetical protein